MTSENVVSVKDVSKVFGKGGVVALQGIDLDVERGDFVSLIGPSGCGKSTVLRTLNRMHEVIPGARVEGSVLLDGENIYGAGIDPKAGAPGSRRP